MPLVLFAFGLFAVLFALNVHIPVRRPGELALMTFGPAWWGGELPIHATLVIVALATALAAAGGLDSELGALGLALALGSTLGQVRSWREATRVGATLEVDCGPRAERVPLWRFCFPFAFGDEAVLCTPGLERDGEGLTADLYRPRHPSGGSPSPVLVYVHGGGWVLGFRRWQGRLLIRRLVRTGWTCVSIQYRLSPRATWPAHIIDVKRAIAWVKRQAPSWGADPERVAISGNSAGGHLAALAALTPGLPDYQPGFETDDTSVAALVSWYGVYDLLDRARAWPHGALKRLWELLVMKQRQDRAADAYRLASPITHVCATSPPTLLLHGTRDTLVPVASARAMKATFDELAPGRCRLLEIEGAEHAFEVFWSRRAVFAVEAAARWLESTLAHQRKEASSLSGGGLVEGEPSSGCGPDAGS
jgi:acetyl esterase/lipase